jgi:nucleotidyltransferase substrate binding protein (TIGR01987 family)
MALELESLIKSVQSLGDLLAKTEDGEFLKPLDTVTRKGLRAGVIQNFEFTYELCWKFMKRWLEKNLGSVYVDGVSKKELFRLAAEHQLIASAESWFEYHRARNETTHIYDEDKAEEVYAVVVRFSPDARAFLEKLKSKND